MGTDLESKYSKGTIIIHWLSAVLILALFPLGKYMEGLPILEKIGLIKIHALLGIVVLLLTIVRSILFFTSKRPEHLSTGSKFNDLLAIAVQRSFYFLLLGIGVTGLIVMKTGGYFELLSSATPSSVESGAEELTALKAHGVLAIIMMALIAMHIIGVIRFNTLHKTNVIKRISK